MVQGRSEKKKQNADKRELKLLIETTARKGVASAIVEAWETAWKSMGGNQKKSQTPNPEANPDPNPGGFILLFFR